MPTLPTVKDYMTTRVQTLDPDMAIMDAVDFFVRCAISGAPVVDRASNRLVGVLSEKDCLKLMAKGAGHDVPSGVVADYMTRDVESIPPNMDIYFVAGRFLKGVYRRFPVVENGELVGILARRDVLRAIQENIHLAA